MLQVMMILSLICCILTAYLFVLFIVRRGRLGKVKHQIGPLFNVWMTLPLICLLGLFLAFFALRNCLTLPVPIQNLQCTVIMGNVNIAFFLMGTIIFSYLALRRIAIHENGFDSPFRVVMWDEIQEYWWQKFGGRSPHYKLFLKYTNNFLGIKWLRTGHWMISVHDHDTVDGFLKEHLSGKLKKS